jgi:hypothetical protein
MPHCQDPTQREFTQLLAVKLAYRKFEWEHVKSGTSGADTGVHRWKRKCGLYELTAFCLVGRVLFFYRTGNKKSVSVRDYDFTGDGGRRKLRQRA